jgi:hypothetical protein
MVSPKLTRRRALEQKIRVVARRIDHRCTPYSDIRKDRIVVRGRKVFL